MNYSLGRIRELVDTAFGDDELKVVCFDNFYQIYNKFTAGQNKSNRVIEIVDYAHRQGQIKVLLEEVKSRNFNVYQEYIKQISTSPNLLKFPEVSGFDLNHTIEQCLIEIIDKQGLIGLLICCSNNLFIKNLCERLKQALRRSSTQIRQPISLNPQITSVDKAITLIYQYQNILNNNDIICPVRVNTHNSNSTIAKDFWIKVQNSFKNKFDHRLIIIIFGSQDCVMPSDVLSLHPPQFNHAHIFEWITDMTIALQSMQAIEEWVDTGEIWRKIAIERCQCEQQNILDVGLVYEHLEYTLNLLKENPSISPKDFLQQLY
jgi:Effector-associated domain 7